MNDFTNFKKLKKIILEIKPTYIINCIGVTKFNKTYSQKKLTTTINTKLPKFLSSLCLLNKIFFIHISTDCVFSGKKGNYNENSLKDSKDLYGLSKNRGEIYNKYTSTIRTSFIGPEIFTKKSLLNWFLSEKNNVEGYNNAFFSGITSFELSVIIYKYFLNKNYFYDNLINIGSTRVSKYYLLQNIKKIFKKKILIKKNSNFKIDRSLNIKKFLKITNYKKKKWPTMLQELKKFMEYNKYKF